MEKLKSTTLWLSWGSLLIIAIIVLKDSSWAAGIAMTLSAIPIAYVTGNKVITHKWGGRDEKASQKKSAPNKENEV